MDPVPEDQQETGKGGVLENSLSDRPVGSRVVKVTQRRGNQRTRGKC